MWRYTSPLALLLGASGLYAQNPGPTPGVGQLIQEAFQRNRDILAAQQRVAEARGLLRQAGVRPVPTVEANAASGRPLGTVGEEQYTIGYFHPIETGGKRPKRILVAEQAVALAEAELSEQSRQLAYDIKARYIEAAAGQRKLDAIESIAKVNRESYRLIDARVQHGDAAPLERQLLLVELNRTQAQSATASGQTQSARSELRRAAGIGPDLSAAPVLTRALTVSLSLADLQKRALDERPDLRAARTLASQSAAELDLAEAMSSPNLTLSAQYMRIYSQFEDPIRNTASGSPLLLKDRDNILSVGIAIPLQNRKKNLGMIEAAAARQNAARLRAEQLAVTIPVEVQAAWERYQAAKNAVAILDQGVLDEAQKNLSVIRQAYDLGQLRLLDVLNEQRRLLETEMTYIDAQAELARARAELERATGGDLQ